MWAQHGANSNEGIAPTRYDCALEGMYGGGGVSVPIAYRCKAKPLPTAVKPNLSPWFKVRYHIPQWRL